MRKILYFLLGVVLLLGVTYLIVSSEPLPSYNPERNYIEGKEQEILSKFLLAKDSTVIEIEEGHFSLRQSLSLDGVNHVTIRGKGLNKTVLSFKGQTKGAEGIRITNSQNIRIENLTVEDAKGDNIKVMDTKGITFNNVQSSWTGKVSKENGAYAFYPVLCKDVVINNCVSIGASDAGIYVGQSNDVIISNNEVFYNVAGIESENSNNVKIFGNKTFENTGGILVFDLPGLTQYGNNIEVYDNHIYSNNTKNFAPKGSIVGQVPSGTGSLVLGTEKVHFYNNTFENNKTASIALASYVLIYEMGKRDTKEMEETSEGVGSVRGISSKFENDKNYNPYPRNVKIGKNSFSNKHWFPTINNDFGRALLFKKPFQTVDVLWDGAIAPKAEYTLCFTDDTNVSFYNLDILNDFKNATDSTSEYSCN